ncbi:MAG: hypothetical protein ACRDRL_10230 [Sciscionella sp.]
MTWRSVRQFRIIAAVGVATLAVTLTVVPAAAHQRAATVHAPTPRDIAAAVAAAHSTTAMRLAESNLRQASHVTTHTVKVGNSGIPAYRLNPAFVRGKKNAPAGVFDYIAVTATASQGTAVTMQVARNHAGHWQVNSVLSGTDEARLAARIPDSDALLYEPQINGWYDLAPQSVTLLQASLPQQPVGRSTPIAAYQRAVQQRYANELPGSTYENQGKIGFTQAGHHHAATAPGINLGLTIGIACAVVLTAFCGGLLLLRRRREGTSTTA